MKEIESLIEAGKALKAIYYGSMDILASIEIIHANELLLDAAEDGIAAFKAQLAQEDGLYAFVEAFILSLVNIEKNGHYVGGNITDKYIKILENKNR